MSRNFKRLIVILLISVTCAFATDRWYKSGNAFSLDYGDRKPVAEMVEVVNEAQRKPLKRLVWRSLSQNDALYSGEMIRTTEGSGAKIVFPETGTEINLEADSMILIGDDGGKLSLEFLKGFLQVKGGKHDALKLKSGNNQIGVEGSELSLGRDDSGAIQLQVLKGEPQIEGADFQRVKDSFQIVKPSPNSMVHVLPTGKDPIHFEWKALEKDHDLVLEVGKSRKEMTQVALNDIQASQATALLPPGDYYWRLIAKPKEKTENSQAIVSSVYRLRVVPKRPPVAISPSPDKLISVKDPEAKVSLRWANPGQLEGIVIEMATSADLRSNSKLIPTENLEFVELELKNNQTYFWRLTGYIPGNHEAVSGPIYSFKLKTPSEFTPPVMISPVPSAKLSQTEVSANGIPFSWQVAAGAQSYQIVISKEGTQVPLKVEPTGPSPLSQLVVRNLPPGEYEWVVKSFDANQGALADTAPRKFKVQALDQIEWLDASNEITWTYGTENPELATAWKNGPKDTASYRISWRDALAEGEMQVQDVATTEFKTSVPKDGRYIASVEALNSKGQVVAKSSDKGITVKPSPLLAAPVLEAQLPDPLKAQRSGKISLSWTEVPGAENYLLEVKSQKGDIVREEKSAHVKTLVSKLLPGDYTVSVRAVDKVGRKGNASTARVLVVPPVSDVSAPTMKKIKVE